MERLMVGLRRVEGANTGDGGRAFLASEEGQRYIDANVVTENDGWLVVNQPLLTDRVIRAVLETKLETRD